MKKNKLHNITSTGYKTPENYFESFEDRLFENLSDEEVIYGIKTHGYAVPKDYFNAVETDIISKLNTKEKPIVNLISKTTYYYVAGIAASLVLMFSLVFSNDNSISVDAIDTVAIENYLYQEDYTNDELATLITPNDISETDFININVSDETLNKYLENIDTEDLILE
jgi:hypothetical protein